MKKGIGFVVILLMSYGHMASAQTQDALTKEELKTLVNEFLTHVNQYEMHDRFWADDLIYTSSSGTRRNKSQILSGMKNSPETSVGITSYSAEEMMINVYDDIAVVAFTLVANDNGEITHYLNSGTFQKRSGIWQVVNWQATHASQ